MTQICQLRLLSQLLWQFKDQIAMTVCNDTSGPVFQINRIIECVNDDSIIIKIEPVTKPDEAIRT